MPGWELLMRDMWKVCVSVCSACLCECGSVAGWITIVHQAYVYCVCTCWFQRSIVLALGLKPAWSVLKQLLY